LTRALAALGVIPAETHAHAVAAIEQKRMADLGIITYGAFVAQKRR
jgi:hypothetical protein